LPSASVQRGVAVAQVPLRCDFSVFLIWTFILPRSLPCRPAEQAAVSSRGPQTRAASRAQAAPPAGRARAAPEPAGSSSRAPQTRATSRTQTAPPAGRARGAPGKERPKEAEEEKKPGELPGRKQQEISQDPPSLGSAEGETDSGAPEGTPPSSATDAAAGQAESVKTPPPSFAPQDFVFQPPQGLGAFSLNPMTPRSADAFLTPTYHWSPRIHPASPAPAGEELTTPEPLDHPVQPAPQHDVPYFRAAMRSEADRLAELCERWGGRTEDPAVPEEVQDLIRTTVGQAHLLMAERFQQFGGLVDDCEFGRGEKETTCTDLEGFWDMVYFQVRTTPLSLSQCSVHVLECPVSVSV
uniref:Discs, large (Drosophila) homolog-associated protein 5 n=1 Tax=Lepisosteus oculatus TaxID=7918 RepID=W5N037_LEPOC